MRISSPKREARYRQLLQAALSVFARDGIDGASVADIAEKAGVAKGSVYLYFNSKEALAGDLVRYIFTYDDSELPLLAEDPYPLARILRFCEGQQRNVEGLGDDSSIVLHMFGHVGKSTRDLLGRGIRQLMAESRFMLQVLIESAIKRQQMPDTVNPVDAAATILACTYGLIHQYLVMDHVKSAPEIKVRDAIITVLRGLGATEEALMQD
jgi:AcrR family transcriptional regulator